MISIIVPFYQRRPGILRRALLSILAQNTTAAWSVTVIDDGSPVEAEEDVAPLRDLFGQRLTLIRQPNRGVSAARNCGLDSLPDSTQTVAFLDSDDEWEAGHLDRIVAATQAGAGFYFENCQRHDAAQSWFDTVGLKPESHRPFDPANDLYWFEGDFFDALFRRSPAITSTVAYNFSALPRLRFRGDLVSSEDIFFWIEATAGLGKIAFSPIMGVLQGAGVNISRPAWGTIDDVERLLGDTRYHQMLRPMMRTQAQRSYNKNVIAGLNMSFWRAALAAGARGHHACCGRLIKEYLALQPSAIARFPAALFKAATKGP